MIGSSGACLEYFPIQAPYLEKKYIMKKGERDDEK